MLKVERLVVEHGAIRAIDGISFEVATGSLAAVIGSNGAGKTTLLRTLSGLKESKLGKVWWNGREITGMKPEDLVRRGISHVSEGKSVIPRSSSLMNRLAALVRRTSPGSMV